MVGKGIAGKTLGGQDLGSFRNLFLETYSINTSADTRKQTLYSTWILRLIDD